jgi:hypothetical protein
MDSEILHQRLWIKAMCITTAGGTMRDWLTLSLSPLLQEDSSMWPPEGHAWTRPSSVQTTGPQILGLNMVNAAL